MPRSPRASSPCPVVYLKGHYQVPNCNPTAVEAKVTADGTLNLDLIVEGGVLNLRLRVAGVEIQGRPYWAPEDDDSLDVLAEEAIKTLDCFGRG